MAVAGRNVADWLLPVAFSAMLLAWLVAKRPVFVSGWMLATTIATLIVTAASAFAGSGFNGFEMLLRVFLTTAAVAIMLTSIAVRSGTEKLLNVLRWWATGIAVNGAFAIAISLNLVSFDGVLEQTSGDRINGLASHPNSLAFSLSLAAPILVYLLASSRRFWGRAWWLACLVATVWGLFLAESRAGLITALPALGVAIFLWVRSSRLRALSIPLLILGAIAAWTYLPQILGSTRLAAGEGDMSNAGRSVINKDALDLFQENPIFGAGFAWQTGVSVPLTILTAGGVVLLIGYAIFALRPVASLWHDRRTLLAATGLLAALSFAVFGLLNPVFMERATYWPIIIPALCGLLLRKPAGTNPWNASRSS